MDKSAKKIESFQLLLILILSACLCCILPFSRNLIILIMERLIGRTLNDMAKWNAVIVGAMSFFATLTAFLYFLLYVKRGKLVFANSKERIIEVFYSKKAFLYIAIIFGIFCLCYLTLFRANYNFQDDIRRATTGHKSWVGSSRYISETLAVFLHTNFYINDISPLTQIYALIILSLTAYMLAYIIRNGNITKLSLIASTLIALCPFYFENISYKFDSPYMAMAMFFGVFPFLFTKNTLSFVSISFISLILVCSSYQAGNSIYIMLALFYTMHLLLTSSKKEAFRFLAICIACYIIALIYFKSIIMVPTETTIDERNTKIQLGFSFLSLLKKNFLGYVSTVLSNFGNIWIRVFTLIAVIIFPFAVSKNTEKRLQAVIISIITLAFMFLLSFGAYLAIDNTILNDRAFMGFDVLLAIVALSDLVLYEQSSKKATKILTAGIVCCLFYGCAIYAVVRGNLYQKQNDYQKFRYTIMLADLSHFVTTGEKSTAYVVGDIGQTESSFMENKNYGLNIGDYSSGWTPVLIQNWNMDIDFMESDSYELKFNQKKELKTELEAMPLLVSSYYHDIYGENNRYLIRFKNPQVKDYEIK